MQFGILGGTFDPIHYGHLLCAEEVRETFGLDRVWFVPAATPPHKPPNPDRASPEHRYAMVSLAVRDNPRFAASRIEIDRGGPSYSIDTVKSFRDACGPEASISWILGADGLADFETWRDHDELLDLCRLIVVTRPAYDVCKIPQWLRERVDFAEITGVDISSTDVRRRVSQGASISYRTPPSVVRYMVSHQLYR